MNTAPGRPRAVLFGKLPSHGDFVARGLDPSASDAWDAWSSAGLSEARAALGEGFEAAHDAAPPWRMITGPGRFGSDWRVGVLAPSVDAAGRRFVVALALDGLTPGQAAASGERVGQALEDLIWTGFEAGWDADRFVLAEAEIQHALAPEPDTTVGAAAQAAERWWTVGGMDHPPQSVAGTPADLWIRMLSPPASRNSP